MSGDRDLSAFHAEGDSTRRTERLTRGYINRREERLHGITSSRRHGLAMRTAARARSPHRKNPRAMELALHWRLLEILANTRRKATA